MSAFLFSFDTGHGVKGPIVIEHPRWNTFGVDDCVMSFFQKDLGINGRVVMSSLRFMSLEPYGEDASEQKYGRCVGPCNRGDCRDCYPNK